MGDNIFHVKKAGNAKLLLSYSEGKVTVSEMWMKINRRKFELIVNIK